MDHKESSVFGKFASSGRSLRLAEYTFSADCVVWWSESWTGHEEGPWPLNPGVASASLWEALGERLEGLIFFEFSAANLGKTTTPEPA